MSCAWIIPKLFPTLVPGRIFFHKTIHWGQKDWGPRLSRALRIHHLEAVGQLDLEVDHCQSSWYRWSGKGSPTILRGWGTWFLSITWVETSPLEPLMYLVWPSLVFTRDPWRAEWLRSIKFWADAGGLMKFLLELSISLNSITSEGVHLRKGMEWTRLSLMETHPQWYGSRVHSWANCRHIFWLQLSEFSPLN